MMYYLPWNLRCKYSRADQYMVQQTLQNKLRDLEVDREVVTLVTQVLVDKNDKSVKNPTKFVGARYTKKEIFKLAKIKLEC